MTKAIRSAVVLVTLLATASGAQAQTAREIQGPSPYVTVANEPPPKVIVDPPIPGPLSQGKVFIQYRTENLRIVPVFGAEALNVSPRIGHMHIIVDDATWPIVHTTDETFVAVGLKPGPHKIVFQLVDTQHRPFPFPQSSQTVAFVVPEGTGAHSH